VQDHLLLPWLDRMPGAVELSLKVPLAIVPLN
jgi:hypothetical protein